MRWSIATVLAAAGCAAAPVAPPPAPEVEIEVSFRGLFGGGSSQSIYDPRGLGPGRMERVLVEEPALLAGERGVEGWLRRRLLQGLGQRGTTVLAPPPAACGEGCAKLAPTAAIRNLAFAAGKDHLRVRVARDANARLAFQLGGDPAAGSLCPRDLELPIHFVQLSAQIQALPEGAIVAELSELAVLGPPAVAELAVRGPPLDEPADPAADPSPAAIELCRAAAAAYAAAPGFASDDERYDEAAGRTIDLALGRLYAPRDP